MALLSRFLNIKEGEGRPVLILFIHFFAYVAISITGSAARDTYFLTLFDRTLLPIMFVAVAAILSLTLAFYTRFTKQLDLIPVMSLTALVAALSLGVIQIHIRGWVIPFLYVWIEIINTLLVIQFWFLAGDVFQPRQAKRLFGILGGGGSLAAIIVGLGIKPFVNSFGSQRLLYLTIGFLLLTIITIHLIKPYRKTAPAKKPTTVKPKQRAPRFDPYLTSIALVVALSAFISRIVDYQFKITAVTFFPVQEDLVNFFGTYYAVAGGATLILQFFVTGRILSRFGVLTGLMILPLILSMGSSAFLVAPVIATIFLAKFSDQVFKFTIHNSTLQLLWLPIPPLKKQGAKPMIEGSLRAVVEGLAGILIYVSMKFIAIQTLSLLVLGAALVWILNTFRLKRGYVQTLEAAIAKRALNFEELEIDVTDHTMVQVIEKALRSDDEVQQLFALELIQGLPLTPWKDTLNQLFQTGSEKVRRGILQLATKHEDLLTDDMLLQTIQAGDHVAPLAMVVAGRRHIQAAAPLLISPFEGNDPNSKAAAATTIIHLNSGPVEQARRELLQMFNDPHQDIRLATLTYLEEHPSILTADRLVTCLQDPSPRIRILAMDLAEKREDVDLLPAIIDNLEHTTTYPRASRTLKRFPTVQVLSQIETQLQNSPSLSIGQLANIIRTLSDYPTSSTLALLAHCLQDERFPVFATTVDTFLAVARKKPLPQNIHQLLEQKTARLARSAYELTTFLTLIDSRESDGLLRDFLHTEILKRIPVLLKLGVMDVPNTPIESYIHTIRTQQTERFPLVLELLENIFSHEEREMVNPLVEVLPLEKRRHIGQRLFPDLPTDLEHYLLDLIYSDNQWGSVLGIDYALRHKLQSVLESIQWDKVDPGPVHRELITRTRMAKHPFTHYLPTKRFHLKQEELSMYSTLEKTLLLKTVQLFQTLPGEEISRIARITQEMHLPAKTPLFKEGDHGESLFIILDGKIQIHKGDKTIAHLGKGDCLGEMALLDQEPRSADATTEEDAILLQITQEGFYELMSSNLEILQGIVRLLTRRLRAAIS